MQKMLEPIKLSVQIKIISGLRIWGSKEWIWKWEMDNPIIRNPRTLEPYIPWSSVKGRMRALIEMQKYADKIQNWSPVQDVSTLVAKAFGCAIPLKIASRLIFSDFLLSNLFQEEFESDTSRIIESKTEVSIWRHMEWRASNPRTVERIVPGMIFDGSITMIPHEWTYAITREDLETMVKDWIKLIEETYLGGYGSRWYGQVKFICEELWLQ
jgi:CRISPR-associated protein Csm3